MNKALNADAAPKAVGPYSHSVLASETLYISGQLGIDPTTSQLQDGVTAQAEQAMANLGAILKNAGMDYTNITKTTIFIKNMADFSAINEIYGRYFTKILPARSCIAVAELPLQGLFEVEAVAVK